MPVIIVNGGAGKIKNTQAHRRGIKKALAIGWTILINGGSALDAVCEAVRYMEDSAIFNCGSGSCLTLDGKVEMDASVMCGDGKFGAVGAIEGVKNPILVARKVMEETDHLLLVGNGARQFAFKIGFPKYQHISEMQKRRLAKLLKKKQSPYFPKLDKYIKLGTVGAVALDKDNALAVANSTGGILGKLSGRIGDTPIFGAGVFASLSGAVAATGHGEAIVRLCLSKYVVELMSKTKAQDAIKQGIKLATQYKVLCGLIGLDCHGNIGYGYTTQTMSWGYIDRNGKMRIF